MRIAGCRSGIARPEAWLNLSKVQLKWADGATITCGCTPAVAPAAPVYGGARAPADGRTRTAPPVLEAERLAPNRPPPQPLAPLRPPNLPRVPVEPRPPVEPRALPPDRPPLALRRVPEDARPAP